MALAPPYLKPGDTVAIVATARKVSKEELEPAVSLLEGHGLRVALGKHIFESHHQFAGTDQQRAEDLQWAINDLHVKAIIVARGGYGTVRIIDMVNTGPLKKSPKWLAGYSDVTVLHSALHKLGIASIHSTMPINFLKHEASTLSLKQLLFGEALSYEVPAHPLNRPGEARGEIVGGNLSLLYALAATPTDLDTRSKILFIEDLDEYLYHIDRMVLQLKRSGKLAHLGGLIVGGMSDMKDNTIPYGQTAEQIIAEAVSEYHYPVCFGFPAGHTEKNLALYFGREAYLQAGAHGTTLKYT